MRSVVNGGKKTGYRLWRQKPADRRRITWAFGNRLKFYPRANIAPSCCTSGRVWSTRRSRQRWPVQRRLRRTSGVVRSLIFKKYYQASGGYRPGHCVQQVRSEIFRYLAPVATDRRYVQRSEERRVG